MGLREYYAYCPKCGFMSFVLETDTDCMVCRSQMVEAPPEYDLTNQKAQEDYAGFKQNQQRLLDEVIRKSPEFDINLHNNKDAMLKKQDEERKEMWEMVRRTSSRHNVECPYCHATDVKRISTTSKAIHTAIFGIFSLSRNSKQWHCNNCNSDF